MNKNNKFNKEKTLALVLAGGLVTSTLNVVNTSAEMIQDVNLIETVNSDLSNETFIPSQRLNFDKSKPSDIVITGVKFNNQEIKSILIGEKEINLSDIKTNKDNETVTISASSIRNLDLNIGSHSIAVYFSDGSAEIGAASLNVTDSDETNDENGTFIPSQKLNFDKGNPSDIVITGVKFNNQKITSILIGNKEIKPSDIQEDKDNGTATISANIIENLDLSIGSHSIAVYFSDGSAEIGAASLNVTNSNEVTDKDDNVTPPSDKEDTVIKNPIIKGQTLIYDVADKKDLIVTDVNFDGAKLEYIYINGKQINAQELTILENKIVIPSSVVSEVINVVGNYSISFKFSNAGSLINAVDITVKDGNGEIPPVTPPSDKDDTEVVPPSDKDDTEVVPPSDEKENVIVIDKNNLKNIEIPNFIPVGSKVEFVTINGKKLPVKYMSERTASNDEIVPAVYVYGDKLVIPVEVLKYVGVDVDKYDVEATLEDGTTVSKSIQLEVINSSDKEDDKVTEKPSDNNETTNEPTNKPSNNKSESGNTNKNDSIKSENNSNNKLPNTGAAVSSGLIGSLSTLIGAVLLRKKK